MNIDFPLLRWQREAFADNSFIRVCICGRGSGKTAYLGFEAFVAAMQGQQIIIAAPTLHRSQSVLKEAKSIAHRFNLDFFLKKDNYYKIGRNKNDFASKGFIYLASDVQPDNARGENANMLIIDEAAYCNEYFFTDVLLHATRLALPSPKILIATTPLGTENWVSQMYLKADGNKYTSAHHADYLENVFTSKETKEYIEKDYMERNEMAFRRELLGEILDYTENSPFTQFLKRLDFAEEYTPGNEPVKAGVDLALGGDFTAVAVRQGDHLLALRKKKTDEDQVADLIGGALNSAGYAQADVLYYDSGGMAKFAKNLLNPLARKCIPVNFGAKATDKRCVNLRAQCYIGLMDRMRKGITYGTGCKNLKDELVRDLMATRTTPDESNQGRFGLVPKDQIKKEIGRSPDIGDAVALAFLNYNPPDLRKAIENMAGIYG
jgi:hypothetical protein